MMEKFIWTNRVNNKHVLQIVEERDIPRIVKRRKDKLIVHILRRNCLLKQDIEGKREGNIEERGRRVRICNQLLYDLNPYPTAFLYGNGMVLHFYQQQESSTTKTVHKVINKGLKAYV